MKKVRILMSATVPLGHNGITKVMLNINRYLNHSLYHVDYISTSEVPSEISSEFESYGGNIKVISREISHPLRFVHSFYKVCRGYDVVHVHGNSGTMALEMMAAALACVPIRITHCHSTSCKYKVIDKIFRPIMYLFSNVRIACGEKSGQWLYKNKSFFVFNNAIDAKKYLFSSDSRESIRKEFDIDDGIVIGHVGNFEEVKNHSFLIEVFNSLQKINKKVYLVLLGDGILKDTMIQKAKDLDIMSKVRFLGSRSNVQEFISAMDIIVMPSFYEGVPLTLIEEQANGLKCVVSDSVSREVDITGNIKFYSLNEDKEKWVNVIESLILDIDLTNIKKRTIDSQKNIEKIRNAGFDIVSQIELLEKRYIKE